MKFNIPIITTNNKPLAKLIVDLNNRLNISEKTLNNAYYSQYLYLMRSISSTRSMCSKLIISYGHIVIGIQFSLIREYQGTGIRN